jgi:hypothetical protein
MKKCSFPKFRINCLLKKLKKFFKLDECENNKPININIPAGTKLTDKQILFLGLVIFAELSKDLSLILTKDENINKLGDDPNFLSTVKKMIFHMIDFSNNQLLLTSQVWNDRNYKNMVDSFLNLSVQSNNLDLLAKKIMNNDNNSNLHNLSISSSQKQLIIRIIVIIVILIAVFLALYYMGYEDGTKEATTEANGTAAQKLKANSGTRNVGQYAEDYDPASAAGIPETPPLLEEIVDDVTASDPNA